MRAPTETTLAVCTDCGGTRTGPACAACGWNDMPLEPTAGGYLRCAWCRAVTPGECDCFTQMGENPPTKTLILRQVEQFTANLFLTTVEFVYPDRPIDNRALTFWACPTCHSYVTAHTANLERAAQLISHYTPPRGHNHDDTH